MLQALSECVFPCLVLGIITASLILQNDTVRSFVTGAKEGFSAIFAITPNILAIMLAANLFRDSGALAQLLHWIAPILNTVGIPEGIAELILLRPISGSGAMVLLSDVFAGFGPDSYEGMLASVICASTETTLYTIMVYFGVTKVKNTRLPLTLGLLTDAVVVFLATIAVNFLIF
ncbi:MAG: spore maturation protein [Clostridia bacterium]|nr:spore maturation protein [Clostridia bacterium]